MSAPATSVDLRRVRPRSRFRADIEGLRAVAVLWVVAFHAGLPFVPGGFTGVDIFFVISGFLITGILLHEAESGGRVAIADFYARRVRRILPATVAMVVGVALLAQVTLSPLRQADTGLDIVFTGLFVVNWHFAAQAVDYLGSQADPSALQHMWSLSVEEQFYAVLPWLVAALALLAHRRRFPVRPVMGAAVTVVLVASFAWCVHQTAEAPGLAYFSSLTRAWELGLGAALAVIAPWLQRLPRIAAALLGWAGIVLVVLAGVRIDTDTPFPGTAALLPTLGAAALIAAGTALPHAGASRLLAVRPLPRIGGVSYGWYLWHWPLLVLASEWHGAALPVAVGIAIVAVAYLLAELSARFVEQPDDDLESVPRVSGGGAMPVASDGPPGAVVGPAGPLATDLPVPPAMQYPAGPPLGPLPGQHRPTEGAVGGHPGMAGGPAGLGSAQYLAAPMYQQSAQQWAAPGAAIATVPDAAPATPHAVSGEWITCPECGESALIDPAQRRAEDFCTRCDFPLFWARNAVVAMATDETGGSLRRLPGTVGRAATASVACPHCGEPNSPVAIICIRCSLPMVIVQPEPEPEPEPVYVPPPPPEPEPEARFPWWWVIGASAALVIITILVAWIALAT